MEEKKILLCCGMGMSSGFLATSARKAAKKEKLPYKIEARSEAEVEQYINSIDCLLVGPHYANKVPAFKEMAKETKTVIEVIPEDIYGSLDGKSLLKMIKKMLSE
ncbi:PTS system cellobiose-specific IIB component [Lactobacillus colini]|uniref:PTS system cellobiose-specific IIB component n=1 Tax=Lactobacillus colini TaxID=1819254 RepID=A0ABS4MGX8_9LACO|nr:PTS sugar transporter subunit IIB [Lactobacillus colini]MBP2058960.1 PTS system cellobiose-specific IIB component [Lactobacillus colini]